MSSCGRGSPRTIANEGHEGGKGSKGRREGERDRQNRGNAARLQWPWHHVVALLGYFVGPATSELVAVILGYRMYNEFFHRHERTLSQLFTDSETAFGYAYNDPTSPEGQKLCPLIHLMRAEIRSHPELTLCLCRGTENLAHPLAYNALQKVGPDNGEPPWWFASCGFAPPPGWAMDGDLLQAIQKVEFEMIRVHPVRTS